MQEQAIPTAFLRLGLSIGFLSAVADRFGIWGPYGTPNDGWGDMGHFLPYVAKLNPWFPSAAIPAVAWLATLVEVALGILLLLGIQTRWAARVSGWLLLAFALGMTAGPGIKAAFNYSVFAASGGAFLLATARSYAWSVDEATGTAGRS